MIIEKKQLKASLKSLTKKIGLYPLIVLIRKNPSSQNKQEKYDEFQFRNFARYVRKAKNRMPSFDKVIMIDSNDHEIIWAIMWGIMVLPLLRDGYRFIVLTRKNSAAQNRYYKLFGCNKFVFIDDFYENKTLPESVLHEVDELFSSNDIEEALLQYCYKSIPVGKITLSGYCRYEFRGRIYFNSPEELSRLKRLLIKNLIYAYYVNQFIEKVPDIYITSESFHDDHGVFYYYMLSQGVNVIKMNKTGVDNCVFIQKRTKDNDGIHHNTVTRRTFELVCKDPQLEREKIKKFVYDNFIERYSDKWHLSKRNFKNTFMADREKIIKEYNLDSHKKIATVFSHIFYDTLYFFEEELFSNYIEWLVTTLECASKNTNLNWLVKLHPSNIWRGEFKNDLECEEVRVIKEYFHNLPEHIKLVYPSTKINPLSWIKNSDFGITARGTIGMEMPCFGNRVITAAKGRYSDLGFTIDPKTKDEYREILLNLQSLPPMTEREIRLTYLYYYTIFFLKPFPLAMLRPVIRSGFKEVRLLGSLYLEPTSPIYLNSPRYSLELESFAKWAEMRDKIDYISGWEEYVEDTTS